jgi:peptide deformylase
MICARMLQAKGGAVLHRPICVIPREAAVLRARSVKCRDVAEVRAVIRDLEDTWPTVAAHGIAAPQIGISKRLFIYRPHEADEDAEPTVLLNPKVIRASGEIKDYDGCLSVPGIYGETRRAERIEISALTVDGETVRLKFEGFTARIIQHEMDHLDGVLFIDRLDSLDDLYTLEEVTRTEAERGAGEEEPRYRSVPLTPDQYRFIADHQRPLPGYALRW